MGTYGGIKKLYKVRGTKTEHSDVATYGGISKIYIIHIRFYLFFCFTDKVCGTKSEHSDVATYGRRIYVYIFLRTNIWLMSNLLTADNRPGFQGNVDTYDFAYLLRSNQYFSN